MFSERLGRALVESAKAQGDDTTFAIGTKVEIVNEDYFGELAEVVGHDTNLFGSPLVDVKLSSGHGETSFYPHELKVQTPCKTSST